MGNCVFKPPGCAYISDDNEYKTVKLIQQGDKTAFELFVKEKNIDLNRDVYGKCFWFEDWRLCCETVLIPPLYIANNLFQSNIEFVDMMLSNRCHTFYPLYMCAFMNEEKKDKFTGLLRIYTKEPDGMFYQEDINELMILYCCEKRNINVLIF
jgi:hypothetical protein